MQVAVILEFLRKILTNKWFWIGLGIIILLLILKRYWYKFERFFQRTDIDLAPGETGNLTIDKKSDLKDLASRLYSDIYDTPITGHTTQLYKDANSLTDTELKYMAKYYRQHLTQGIYLYEDVNDEVFNIFTNVDSKLMAHLAKVGEKG